jgi:Transposase IS66 family
MIPKVPSVPEEQRTDAVVELLEIIRVQRETIQHLRDEIARLKGQKPKPDIKPSKLEQGRTKEGDANAEKRPGSAKRSKTKELPIHETKKIRPEGIPWGSRFKGYRDYVVQDIIIKVHTTNYRLECWQTLENGYSIGKLPEYVTGHFGPALVTYMLYQYYHAQVTQPLLREQLLEFGVEISSGQVNRIITEGKERFHAEKEAILKAGLEVSGHINVDDTGARHEGRNGYCTYIGNQAFAWFQSTGSKSRRNFLELLRTGYEDYVINAEAIQYMAAQGLPGPQLANYAAGGAASFESLQQWEEHLHALAITDERHIRIVTEAALLGSVLAHGFNRELVIVSDDAGQFNILMHALCWVHAERTINKLVGFNDQQKEALEEIRSRIWDLYGELKDYKKFPDKEKKVQLEKRFDELCTSRTCFASLNLALKRLHTNKSELLMVLERPDIPLHNNTSENDLRDYVKKRKISGSTRSGPGRRCRDTFTSLKKTCRKHKVSFWEYLKDRVTGQNVIARLPDLIRSQTL